MDKTRTSGKYGKKDWYEKERRNYERDYQNIAGEYDIEEYELEEYNRDDLYEDDYLLEEELEQAYL